LTRAALSHKDFLVAIEEKEKKKERKKKVKEKRARDDVLGFPLFGW
jgi:hypothetical protein